MIGVRVKHVVMNNIDREDAMELIRVLDTKEKQESVVVITKKAMDGVVGQNFRHVQSAVAKAHKNVLENVPLIINLIATVKSKK